ncbi:MAG: hypothetical protein FK730_04290 [Asgard group archaeon]|nr:hypothetical protein [Asgard group archaeon]
MADSSLPDSQMPDSKKADSKKIWNLITIIWLVIMIVLWVTYQWLPGNIFMWMWIAIGWSAIGGVFGSIHYATNSKRNLVIVCIIWGIVLAVLWPNFFLTFLPGEELHWYWITISSTIAVGIIGIGILILKLLKKTQW